MITVIRPAPTIAQITQSANAVEVTQKTNVVNVNEMGIQGPPGPVAPLSQALAGENLKKGQPLYIDLITGQARLAMAAEWTRSAVIGLCDFDTLSGFVTPIAAVKVIQNDWTLVAGVISLSPGVIYYLSPVAGFVTTQQITAGQTLVTIGMAVSATTLIIRPSNRILL